MCENKGADQLTAKLICAFVFTTLIVHSLSVSPAPKRGMVKFSRKGHFQRVACKEGTFKRAATCKEGTFKPASFIFSPALSSFTFLSQFTNPLEAGCCYCQPKSLRYRFQPAFQKELTFIQYLF